MEHSFSNSKASSNIRSNSSNNLSYQQKKNKKRLLKRRRRRIHPGFIITLIIFIGFALLSVALSAGILTYYGYYQFTGRIIPGVHVGKLDLTDKTITQAAIMLHKEWELEHQITVTDGTYTTDVPPTNLGLRIDSLGTAKRAYSFGHQPSLLRSLGDLLASYQNGYEILPTIHFDENIAKVGLEDISRNMLHPPTNASFRLEGTNIISIPGKLGYTVDIDESIALLSADPTITMINGSIILPLTPVAPRVNDSSPAIAEVRRIIDSQVIINAYDPISDTTQEWKIPKEELASWMKIDANPDGSQIYIDENQVKEYLNNLSTSIGPELWIDADLYSSPILKAVGKDSQVSILLNHLPTKYIVQRGDTLLKIGWDTGIPFWMIRNANPGIDPDNLWAGTELVIPSKDELLPLPVIPNKRIVISIDKQRLWVYQDGELLSKHLISTGVDRSPTQPGIFQVQTHDKNAYASVWDLYMPDFLGIYEAWPGFLNGIHGLPTLANGRRLWANILGQPASYGCIILDLEAANWLYNWAENGVVVEIRP